MKSMLISALMASIAFGLAASRINNGLIDSSLPPGPGLTLDESFNIGQGVYLFEVSCDHGPLLYSPSVAKEVFGQEGYLPDHPPLGRFVLGAAHQLTASSISGAELSLFNVPAARLGSCFAFSMTVLLLFEFAKRKYGLASAVAACVLLMLMPRAVAHARLASLESTTTFFWLAAFVPLFAWWTSSKPPTSRQCVLGGFVWGLLLLTKVQGILIPPLLVGWAIWQYRLRAIKPLAIWGVTGFVTFFVGWPWLWLDPVANVLEYFGRASERPTLYVWYFGERFADKAVPWHYPFVMLLVTTPFCVTASVCWRIFAKRFQSFEVLAAASVVWPLLIFAMPGTPVYDGVRLFLVVLPVIALLAGRGFVLMAASLRAGTMLSTDTAIVSVSKSSRAKRVIACCLLVVMAVAIVFTTSVHQAFCLNDYPGVPGGSKVAVETLQLEASYWSDGLNGDFWNQVPENSVVYVAPVSHQFQLSDIQQLVPIVRQRNITLLPFQYDPAEERGLLLLLHRLADLPPLLRSGPTGAPVVADVKYRGVMLARLVDTSVATWDSKPSWPGEQ